MAAIYVYVEHDPLGEGGRSAAGENDKIEKIR